MGTLGTREKQILFERAGRRCEACGKELDYSEMQVGHKTAASKGGSATLRNSVCLCYRCNKLQGTDSWAVFLKKIGKQSKDSRTKEILKGLSLQKLKFLAKKYHVRVKGRTEEGWISDNYVPPSKRQYVNALAKQISESEIEASLNETPTSSIKGGLKIDELEIEDKNLLFVNVGYDKEIYFSGRALDDEGRDICHRLSKFRKGSTVDVVLESNPYGRRRGFYELYETVIQRPEVRDRTIYRFSGKLRPVY